MIFTSLSSLALLSGMVLFSNAAPYYPSLPRSLPATHFVNVSNDAAGLSFDPPYINATLGDQVSFKFHIKNHTVTQSSFEKPCTPLQNGTDTNFVPVTPGTPDDHLPVVTLTVAKSGPIWVHCRQAADTAASHCGEGMVFAINPGPVDSNNSFAAYQQNAKAIGDQLKQMSSNSTNQTVSNGTASNSTNQMASNGTASNCTDQMPMKRSWMSTAVRRFFA